MGSATRRILLAPAFALVAIIVSFASPRAAFVVFLLALIPPLFPRTRRPAPRVAREPAPIV